MVSGKKYAKRGKKKNKIKTHTIKRHGKDQKMKCKVFAATTRSTQNMRQMTMERELPSGDSHVVLDVKYCGVLYIINRVGVF